MIHVHPFFSCTVPETTSLLLLQPRRYSSLILFLKHIKFVMNIILYYFYILMFNTILFGYLFG
jgi:hypothetical protein